MIRVARTFCLGLFYFSYLFAQQNDPKKSTGVIHLLDGPNPTVTDFQIDTKYLDYRNDIINDLLYSPNNFPDLKVGKDYVFLLFDRQPAVLYCGTDKSLPKNAIFIYNRLIPVMKSDDRSSRLIAESQCTYILLTDNQCRMLLDDVLTWYRQRQTCTHISLESEYLDLLYNHGIDALGEEVDLSDTVEKYLSHIVHCNN